MNPSRPAVRAPMDVMIENDMGELADDAVKDPYASIAHRYYHPAKPIDHRVAESTTVMFDEGLHEFAISSLTSILQAHLGRPQHLPGLQFPTPNHLSFLATLAVHPSFTSHAKTPDTDDTITNVGDPVVAVAALELFRMTTSLGGPSVMTPAIGFSTSPELDAALSLAGARSDGNGPRRTRRVTTARSTAGMDPTAEDGAGDKRARRRQAGSLFEGEDDENTTIEELSSRIRSPLAKSQSVWTTGADFWRVFGWAMNCATAAAQVSKNPDGNLSPEVKAMAKRWPWWNAWLEAILEVIEADWADAKRKQQGSKDDLALISSHALRWMLFGGTGTVGRRRIQRALFAGGADLAVAEFGPVWADELSEDGLDLNEGDGLTVSADWGAKLRCKVIVMLLDFAVHVPEHFSSLSSTLEIIVEGLIDLESYDMFCALLNGLPMLPNRTVQGGVILTHHSIAIHVLVLMPLLSSIPPSLQPFLTSDVASAAAARMRDQIRHDLVKYFLPLSGPGLRGRENKVNAVLEKLLCVIFLESEKEDGIPPIPIDKKRKRTGRKDDKVFHFSRPFREKTLDTIGGFMRLGYSGRETPILVELKDRTSKIKALPDWDEIKRATSEETFDLGTDRLVRFFVSEFGLMEKGWERIVQRSKETGKPGNKEAIEVVNTAMRLEEHWASKDRAEMILEAIEQIDWW